MLSLFYQTLNLFCLHINLLSNGLILVFQTLGRILIHVGSFRFLGHVVHEVVVQLDEVLNLFVVHFEFLHDLLVQVLVLLSKDFEFSFL